MLAGTALASQLQAQDYDPDRDIVVIAPGGAVDSDDAALLDEDAIGAGTRADLASALTREVPGVTVGEAAGNPWQASITWRGYGVSALQGTEQGMAVYLDGVRFNQPFGDTLALDLLPEAALAGAELREASPVFGRNALGGALLLRTATGAERPGLRGSLHGDSFGGYGLGASWGAPGAFVAVEGLHDEGWRDASPSRILRGLVSIEHAGPGWGIGAKLLGADTRLFGNGVAPVELLDADYRAIFTSPDTAQSSYGRVLLLPYVDLSATGRLEATLHFQALRRVSANGDLADFDACDPDPRFLCLEDDDDGFTEFLRDPAGNAVAVDPVIDDYAVFNRGRERTHGGGVGLQYLDERETAAGTRRFAIGFAWESYRTRFGAFSELGELEEDRSVEALGTVLSSDDGGITSVDVISRLRDFALFASAEIPLSRLVTVEAGARWSDNRVELIDQIGTDLNGIHRFRRFSPSLEIDITPAEGWELALGASETSRNPTPAELSCADPDSPCALANFFVADPPLKQVVARNLHAELRREAGPFAGHVALWRSDSRDDIRHIASEVRGRAYFANLGRSRKQGIELAAAWRSGPWSLAADYGFTDARFRTEFDIASPSNPAADEDGLVEVEPGDRLPAIPRHAANLRAGYDSERWGVALALRYRSGQVLVGDDGNDNAQTPDYAVADLRAHFALTPSLTLVGEVRNILDEKYATFGTLSEVDEIFLAEAPGASDPRAYAPGMPRRFSLALKASF